MPARPLLAGKDDLRIALVLSGGNALGAYHAGLYEALHEADVEPEWIVGTSIGAVTGAIIGGNAPDQRIDRLRALWRPATPEETRWPTPWDLLPDDWRRTGAVLETLLAGRPGMFGPIGSLGSRWRHDHSVGTPALYDTGDLVASLAELVDFECLSRGNPRFTAIAIDIGSGEEVVFDSAKQPIIGDHIRASAAMLTAYPAVEIDGRLCGDGGLAMNLPLDPVLAVADDRPTLCIAADLMPLTSQRPTTLGEVVARMQDLSFAAQSRRTIARWTSDYAARPIQDRPSVTLSRLAYTRQEGEVAGKALDFSPRSLRQRWIAGREDGKRFLERLHAGEISIGKPGLSLDPGPA